MIMIAVTIALGASLATAMLNIMLDVGDKVNQELKTYGANITVVPKESSVLNELYETEGDDKNEVATAYLKENEIGKLKTIFWAFNIVDFAPFASADATLDDNSEVKVVGTWYNHHLSLPTGEELDAGVTSLRSWWEVKEGEWIDESALKDSEHVAMVGSVLAEQKGLGVGDTVTVRSGKVEQKLKIVAVFDSGGDEDEQIYTTLDVPQALSNTKGLISSIEVSALTTPDNELAVRAAKDPKSLSVADYETWYCTAYASSICYQIQEVITDSVASPVRQVADSEGNILEKTQLLMILITILSLLGSALGISNLVTTSVMERSKEIGLLKAIGARKYSITGLVLTEIIITAIVGGFAGYFMGYGFAQIIGHTVFGSGVDMKPMVIPIVIVLIVAVTILGSIPAIRTLLRLRPAEVLHGR